jgi:hypothetical protein
MKIDECFNILYPELIRNDINGLESACRLWEAMENCESVVYIVTHMNKLETNNMKAMLDQITIGLRLIRTCAPEKVIFVVRVPTIFEPFTISLLYILSSIFSPLHVIRPLTSRDTRNEIFIVGYTLIKEQFIEKFANLTFVLLSLKFNPIHPERYSLYPPTEMDQTFFTNLAVLCRMYLYKRKDQITTLLNCHGTLLHTLSTFEHYRTQAEDSWIDDFMK